MTEQKKLYLEFWTGFKAHVQTNDWSLKVDNLSPQARYYMDIRFGYTGIHLSLHLKDELMLTGLYIKLEQRAKYHQLNRHRNELETILGPIEWIEETPNQVSRLVQSAPFNSREKQNWKLAYNWLGIKSYDFQEVAKRYLK